MKTYNTNGIEVNAAVADHHKAMLTEGALCFVRDLVHEFADERNYLLEARIRRQAEFDAGHFPDFLPETSQIRSTPWTVFPTPKDLLDRRVEITGPASDRKMVINGLNSGANVYMADLEDSHAPTWTGTLDGQLNIRDSVNKTITCQTPGKTYTLNEQTAVLMMRPRGLHLPEKHIHVDGKPTPASLFDLGLFLYHNARTLLHKGTGPYAYIPKMENHREARWWNDVFSYSENELGIPYGSIKATPLIETITAAFEMHEILYELRHHATGLNCGRWDYIFSFIKKFRNHPEFVLPDRAEVTMTTHFLKSYVDLLVQTCHQRGAHAMGGMAAQIPIKNDPAANEAAMDKVRADKLREVLAGHDGTWVAHPGLVPIAREIFDKNMGAQHQQHVARQDVHVTAADLLKVPQGNRTEHGVRYNTRVGIQYTEALLRGQGCVPLYHVMEDAATAEISRSQAYQMRRHGVRLSNGKNVTKELITQIASEELRVIEKEIGSTRFADGKFPLATELFLRLTTQDTFEEFLTIPSYEHL
ncbi:malate synthase A [Candidatus Woesearchaeota archaeon]|nr:malate synthase A [Candidatus Woesearchaeota archaeon]